MIIKRRGFLKTGALASAGLMFPNFLKSMTLPDELDKENKILVIHQLSGGNDGLNTVIPVKNDIYFRERKSLSIRNALSLTDEAGIHPALPFKELFDNGKLAVLNNVGYPDPNKSHFRSMIFDIPQAVVMNFWKQDGSDVTWMKPATTTSIQHKP